MPPFALDSEDVSDLPLCAPLMADDGALAQVGLEMLRAWCDTAVRKHYYAGAAKAVACVESAMSGELASDPLTAIGYIFGFIWVIRDREYDPENVISDRYHITAAAVDARAAASFTQDQLRRTCACLTSLRACS